MKPYKTQQNNSSKESPTKQDSCSNSHGKQSVLEENDLNTSDPNTHKRFDQRSCLGISLVVNVLIFTIVGIVLGVLLSKKPGKIGPDLSTISHEIFIGFFSFSYGEE